MFCKYCGKEIADDAVFCSGCGKQLEGESAPKQAVKNEETETKTFTFGGLSYNNGNIKQINEWLASQSIQITSVSINTFMNNNFPLKWETVINRFEIKYKKSNSGKHYQLGYFKSIKWIGSSYAKVTAKFENWQKENPKKTVAWHTCAGHQAEGGSTQSLFYLYY